MARVTIENDFMRHKMSAPLLCLYDCIVSAISRSCEGARSKLFELPFCQASLILPHAYPVLFAPPSVRAKWVCFHQRMLARLDADGYAKAAFPTPVAFSYGAR